MSVIGVLLGLLALDAVLCSAILVFWVRSDRRAVRAEAFAKKRWDIEDERYADRVGREFATMAKIEERLYSLAEELRKAKEHA